MSVLVEVVYRQGGKTKIDLVEEYSSLEDAIREMADVGWEDDDIGLFRSTTIFRESDTGVVVATVQYVIGTGPHPDQLFTFSDGSQRRYRYVADQNLYHAELI